MVALIGLADLLTQLAATIQGVPIKERYRFGQLQAHTRC
jgi:hypothetical protein